MKKYYFLPMAITVLLVAVSPQLALAHGHTSFEINAKIYSFTVGSLNEPVAVDDKTGVDIRVASMARHAEGGGGSAGTPVAGLEKTLKVELVAGDKKKILELSPVFGTVGAYKANFVPTIQTTLGYRLFGTIDDVPFDYTFTCNPAGHPQTPEDTTEVEISEGVVRVQMAGAFGCPAARADLGFPEPAASVYELDQAVANAQMTANVALAKTRFINFIFGLAAAGLVVAAYAVVRHSKCEACRVEEKKA